jgi:phosphohistidine phosphatase SixA
LLQFVAGAGALVAAALLLSGCAGFTYTQAPPMEEVVNAQRAKEDARSREIVAELRRGGYVIFLRHTKTDWDQKDIEPFNFDDCATQRNLTEEGRAQASMIGEAYRALEIPIAEVLTSPFCRCVDTAALAFGDYEVNRDLAHIAYAEDKEGRKRTAYLRGKTREFLSAVPPPGKNTVLVGHSPNLIPIIDIRSLPEGNTVVFKPDGKGSFEIVGMILPNSLARIYKTPDGT